MKKIGITGGIGSGKTFVANIFKTLGIPVYDADKAAKQLMNHEPLRNKLIQLFGNSIYNEQGELNRPVLASLIFNDKKKLDAVNALVHPAVAQHFNIWCNKQNADYILKEAAIMFESGANKILDAVICVTAPETTRIERAMKRDNTSEEKIKTIIARQLNEEDRNKRCNYLIKNDGTEPLLPQVLKIHDLLKGK